MFTQYDWGDDLLSHDYENTSIGLEAFKQDLSQGTCQSNPYPFFKPVNIVVEKGIHYATLYVCQTLNGDNLTQQTAIWLSTLKETDAVHLTITSLANDVPLFAILDIMVAIANTRAKVTIHLNQIVVDSLAYFYLIVDEVEKGCAGALFIPSYVDQRDQDTSGPWKAIHDFYKHVVENAVAKGLLTTEEASKLDRGSHVVIPKVRFDMPLV